MRPIVQAVDRLQRLGTFEAAARLGSFSAAGRELGLAQPAVTRQIQALERSLGTELFHRTPNRIELTESGRALFDATDVGFGSIERSLAELAEQTSTVVLAMPPGFAQQLVVPRLDDLQRMLGDRDLRLWLYDRERELERAPFDVAVRVGAPPWPGHRATVLFEERVVPVATPSLAEEWGLDRDSTAAEVLAAPLLHMDAIDRAWMSWTEWLAAAGLALTPGRRRIEFNNYPAVLQQAVTGKGIALAWAGVTDELVVSGVLQPVGPEVVSIRSYCATWPDGSGNDAVDVIVGWLSGLIGR